VEELLKAFGNYGLPIQNYLLYRYKPQDGHQFAPFLASSLPDFQFGCWKGYARAPSARHLADLLFVGMDYLLCCSPRRAVFF